MFDLYSEADEPQPFAERVYALEFPRTAYTRDAVMKKFKQMNWPKPIAIQERDTCFRAVMNRADVYVPRSFSRAPLGEGRISVIVGRLLKRDAWETEE